MEKEKKISPVTVVVGQYGTSNQIACQLPNYHRTSLNCNRSSAGMVRVSVPNMVKRWCEPESGHT